MTTQPLSNIYVFHVSGILHKNIAELSSLMKWMLSLHNTLCDKCPFSLSLYRSLIAPPPTPRSYELSSYTLGRRRQRR
jgi:hypothetical protein